jgi:hypothetical protein
MRPTAARKDFLLSDQDLRRIPAKLAGNLQEIRGRAQDLPGSGSAAPAGESPPRTENRTEKRRP